jgi:hypothetical protein
MKRALALLLFACGPVSQNEVLGKSAQAIVGGTPSSPEDDAVVIVARFADDGSYYQCSGVAIAKRLVLTARHCVDKRPANALRIFVGRDAWSKLQANAPEAAGDRIFSSSMDAAIIHVDRDLTTPIAPVRLEGDVDEGEVVDAIGFGIDEGGKSPALRHRRTGLAVLAVGPTTTRIGDPVSVGEFAIGEAACSGDSGGPARAASGAIIGIASRVGNGTRAGNGETQGAAFCLGVDAHDIYVSTIALAPLFHEAFTAAGETPAAETRSATITVDAEPPVEHGGCR